MGYQLVIWEGQRPEDDAAVARAWLGISRRYLMDDEPVEPTPAIREFVEALTEQWTDDPDDPEWEASPWKSTSLLDWASGPALYLNLTLRRGPMASCIIAHMAEERGLVTFDPQLELLRPVSDELIAGYFRRRSSALN